MSGGRREDAARAIEGLRELSHENGTPLLELAVRDGRITPEQRDAALAFQAEALQKGAQLPLGKILVQLGFISIPQLSDLLRDVESTRTLEGTKIGRYRLIRPLGAGGGGEVWLVEDALLKRHVALKLLTRHSRTDIQRFKREAIISASLDHPGIVKVYDVGESDGHDYIAMQYVDGRTIDEQRLDVSQAVRATCQIAEALEYAHGRGVIHRDIKPTNAMIDAHGRTYLMDFGLAKELGSDGKSLSASGAIIGTPSYMSPEQARGDVRHLDGRTDVYSLGATLYYLLTRRAPIEGSSMAATLEAVQNREPLRLRALQASIPRDLETIVGHALVKEPDRRYQSVREFREDLSRFLAGEPIVARPPSLSYRLRKKIRKNFWPLAAGALAVCSLGALGAYAVIQARTPSPDLVRAREDMGKRELQAQARERAQVHFDRGIEAFRKLERLLTAPTPLLEEIHAARDETIGIFQTALREDDTYGEAALQIARVLVECGDDAKAREWCDRAIRTTPSPASAYLQRALIDLESYERLRRDPARKERAETPRARELRLGIAEDLQKLRSAGATAKEIDYADALLDYARGDTAPAAAKLERYVQRYPGDWKAQLWCGYAQLDSGAADKALQTLNEALKFRPASQSLLTLRALVHQRMGDLDEAIQDYARAFELDPKDWASLFNCALAYAALAERRPGERQELLRKAIAAIDRATKLCEPDHPDKPTCEALAKDLRSKLGPHEH